MSFEVHSTDGNARSGVFQTAHGSFQTPNFMPVGTRASVKGVDTERLTEIGAQILLVNTYHLWITPGPEKIANLGGIQKFMAWNGPVLSDSGGFQVYSLQKLRKLSSEGIEFRSHLDGAKLFLTPERCIEIQETLGVDIAMMLDECPPAGLPFKELEASLELTLAWAKRAVAARTKTETALFGITQGGTSKELRTRAIGELSQLPFDGFAIGGLSVGEAKSAMYEIMETHAPELPSSKIRYLMGVGTPRDLVEAVYRGVDLFDCVIPTRAGRFGRAYIKGDLPFLNIKNKISQTDAEPLDLECRCIACRLYSRAYLHHLFRVGEMLGPQLLSIHNLTHYWELMSSMRAAIREGHLLELYQAEKRRWDDLEQIEDD